MACNCFLLYEGAVSSHPFMNWVTSYSLPLVSHDRCYQEQKKENLLLSLREISLCIWQGTPKSCHAHKADVHFPSLKQVCFIPPLMSFINLASRDCWLLLTMHIKSCCARGNLIILIVKVTEISKGASLTVRRLTLTQGSWRQACYGRLVTTFPVVVLKVH